ncbi:MAG: Asp-tRNA(Asn)/Glu-tRNA(Gln) amidotransferase subunit GatC [Flavobacteriales bacterium]|nr:Asp-tRNA(Asn)/Glu-tRNA(Gln) amidotransferase subunit GatC [Flavobacteriales bacterium]MBL6872333.1 Asp-tRNA(Asn)/Glu-tRNA(Gln) amidotransferase subunit GatC [Flavobacteriales bacterium]
MKIDQTLIDKLAKLSQLEFNSDAKAKMEDDLNKILEFVDKLNEVDTENIEPLIYLNKETNKLREDEIGEHLPKEKALKNAPSKDSDYFKVPTVLKK